MNALLPFRTSEEIKINGNHRMVMICEEHVTTCLPGVAVYQMETLAVEQEAFGSVARLLRLETVVDPCSGFANKFKNIYKSGQFSMVDSDFFFEGQKY